MLARFTVGNFLSFNKNQTLSLIANSGQKHKERLYDLNGIKLTKFAALYGANAAGKSSFINAIDFAVLVLMLGTEKMPNDRYFKLNPANKDKPSYFEFEICIGGELYAYGFEVIISKRQITEEWLVKLTKEKDITIFTRNTETGNSFFNRSEERRVGKECVSTCCCG